MTRIPLLPPGQRALGHLPRFGQAQFAQRFPNNPATVALLIDGDTAAAPWEITQNNLDVLARKQQTADFHCVTTWSTRQLKWVGYSFQDFYTQLIEPRLTVAPTHVTLRGQDGYRTSLYLEDLLGADVMLADTLAGTPLSVANGAPLRLVAPAHYGYKSVKHIAHMAFWRTICQQPSAGPSFMDHPRARVAQEERGQLFPGWLLRHLYRPLIKSNIARFEQALAAHQRNDV